MATLPRFALSFAASFLVSGAAAAYTPKTTSSGVPVHWRESAITVFVDPSVLGLGHGAVEAVTRAFAAWDGVSGTGAPVVTVVEGPADALGYHDGGNQCTVRYAAKGYEPAGPALAVTISSFGGGGQLFDADIVINGGPERPFALPAGEGEGEEQGEKGAGKKGHGAYDLQGVLTHEAGHFFGLDENYDDPSVTMYFETGRGEVEKRDLRADDEAGLRYLYPPGGAFAASCSSAPGEASWGGAATLLMACALLRRRGARGQER